MTDAGALAVMIATACTVLVAAGWLSKILRSLSPV